MGDYTTVSCGVASVAQLLERGLHAWNADNHVSSILAYEALLGSCDCNTSEPCAALDRQAQLTAHGNCGSAHMMRAGEAMMLPRERVRHLSLAKHHWSIPAQILGDANPNPAVTYFNTLIDADLAVARSTQQHLDEASWPEDQVMRVSPIPRRHVSSLSPQQFLREFALQSRPVILVGLVPGSDENSGTGALLELLLSVCGGKSATMRVHDPSEAAGAWASLKSSTGSLTVSEVYSRLAHARADSARSSTTVSWAGNAQTVGTDHSDPQRNATIDRMETWQTEQLFDYSLPRHCPELFSDSSDDPQQRAPALSLLSAAHREYFDRSAFFRRSLPADSSCALADGWPSLFIQPPASSCGLHVDSYGTSFFQLLLRGVKRWRIFAPDEAARLYPRPPRFKSFQVEDVFAPNYERFPLLRTAHVHEAVLRENEVIFIPAASPHQVFNGEDYAKATDGPVVAISTNYIDGSNVDVALRELHLGAGPMGANRDVARTLEHLRREALRLKQDVEDAAA